MPYNNRRMGFARRYWFFLGQLSVNHGDVPAQASTKVLIFFGSATSRRYDPDALRAPDGPPELFIHREKSRPTLARKNRRLAELGTSKTRSWVRAMVD